MPVFGGATWRCGTAPCWSIPKASANNGQVTIQAFEPGTLDAITFDGVIPVDPCPADTDGDGSVQTPDLLDMLAAWGTGDPGIDIAPGSGDGNVDILDLLALLAAWGPCL